MFRIVKLSGKYYGYDMGEINQYDNLEDFLRIHIRGFVDSGDPVLLVNDLEDAEFFIPGLDVNDIQMVEGKDEDE